MASTTASSPFSSAASSTQSLTTRATSGSSSMGDPSASHKQDSCQSSVHSTPTASAVTAATSLVFWGTFVADPNPERRLEHLINELEKEQLVNVVVTIKTKGDIEYTGSKSIIEYMPIARGVDERELFMEAVEEVWYACDAEIKARLRREAAEKGYRGRDDELFEEVGASGGAFDLYRKTEAQEIRETRYRNYPIPGAFRGLIRRVRR